MSCQHNASLRHFEFHPTCPDIEIFIESSCIADRYYQKLKNRLDDTSLVASKTSNICRDIGAR